MEKDPDMLEAKVDDLTLAVNRMSRKMDDFVTNGHYNPPGGQQNLGYVDNEDKTDVDDVGGQDFSKDENEERGNWTGRLDFLLACLGYAVGLGNVWRFPYLCYKNGGAIFFVPYVIMLAFVGIPIFFLELSLGQFTSSGPLTCWGMAKGFQGIGVAMVIVSGLVGIYYNMIIAWSIFYFFASFTSHLPWQDCTNDWNTEFCLDLLKKDAVNCTELGYNATSNGVCYDTNGTVYGFWNKTLASDNGLKQRLPTEEYLENRVYKQSSGIEEMGECSWELVLCLILAWVIVCASLIKGVKSSGKVVYFTALFPYAVLVILFIRGFLLPGFEKGIEFYILKADISKLQEAGVWRDAAVQIFFSLSASWGGLIALSSYNRFHNDCLRDTLIVSIGNCLTSFFAGFVIFSFIGFLAHITDQEVEDVAKSGVGLAFTIYPYAVTLMPVSPLWAILFFLMLITLGLDSEFALVETVATAILDAFPSTRKRKWLVIICLGVVGFLLGLTLTTRGGPYMLQLMDTYAGGWNVLLIAFCECICIAYVYGFCRFKEDIQIMIGKTPCCCFPWKICHPWWALCWYFFTPVGVLFILIFSWVDYSPATYDDYNYPVWADALGWLMTIVVVFGLVATAVVHIIMCLIRGESLLTLVRPDRNWGPALPKHRRLMGSYLRDDQFVIDPTGDDDIELRGTYQTKGHENGQENLSFDERI